jgi:beta-lactam-binding protein with PASTA domain
VAAGAAGYATIYTLVKTPETQAPEVLTLSMEDALRRASAAGFALRVAGTEPSTAVEKGRVVSQRPMPGEWVKEGGTIVVVVSD